MKIFFTIIFFLCVTFTQVHAQQQVFTRSELAHKFYPGTVTLNDGQILSGYILNNRYSENQDKCEFYTDYKDSRTRKVYKPSEIAAYSVENDQYKSVPYNGNIAFGKPSPHFLYITKPGAINSLVYYIDGQPQPVWQKGNDEAVTNSSLLFGFKKNVLRLVSDYPEVVDKINLKEKGYGMLGIDNIVNEYNAWAAAKPKQ